MIKVKAIWTIEKNGKIVIQKENLITDTGLNFLAERLMRNDLNYIDYCAVGSGTTAPSTGDTSLETEITRKQVTTKVDSGGKATLQTTFNAGEGTGTWKEAGLLNASSGGVLFNRIDLDFVKSAGDSATVTIEIEFVRSS